ncbi:MAG: hypothetical protein AVDCRST_MAG19-4897 [uncultured Thermomicrobiales bacterium]|uniref:Uncharacterized protein n=1 Tax=uncultured Thermomicrobiales bacterium TaxID=1645740 RepID=A0A6J4VVU1_9BACT|nr:MAG: hypothetical protein AVDCRST_MAG19-4897 [uncultured Thermomicrobiales bacterium]
MTHARSEAVRGAVAGRHDDGTEGAREGKRPDDGTDDEVDPAAAQVAAGRRPGCPCRAHRTRMVAA